MSEKEIRHQRKKEEIIAVMENFKDANGNIDLTKLRNEKKNVYNQISYYFGSIDEALVEAGLEAINSKDAAKGAPLNRKTLRNALAYDMLVKLRDEYTLEEIGKRYGVSRAHINQLFQSLSKTFGNKEDEEENVESPEFKNTSIN
jgi:hypothetical protein